MSDEIRSEYPEQQIERLAREALDSADRFFPMHGVPYVIERAGDGSIKARCLLDDMQRQAKIEDQDRIVKQGHPHHVEGTAKLASGDSLIEWCRRFGCLPTRSALFGRSPYTIRAIADYHQDGGQPAWQRHSATFTATTTEAARTWLTTIESSADGLDELIRRWGYLIVDQAAEGTELRVLDTKGKPSLAPSASDLMAWSASLGWSEQEEATIDRAAGTIKSTKTSAGSAFDKFGFWLRFPVFVGEQSIDVQIGLSAKVKSGKLIFTLWPMLGASVVDDAFQAMGARIATATGLYLFEGEPEPPQVMP